MAAFTIPPLPGVSPGGVADLPTAELQRVQQAESAARACGLTESTINDSRTQMLMPLAAGTPVAQVVGAHIERLRLRCVGAGGGWTYQPPDQPGLPPVVTTPPQPQPQPPPQPQPQPPAPPPTNGRRNGNGREMTRGQAYGLAVGFTLGGAVVGGLVGAAVGESGRRGRHAITGAVAGAGAIGAATGFLAAIAG